MKRIFARALGTVILLALTFTIGAAWHDLRGIHNLQTLRDKLSMIPMDVDLAMMTAARGDTDDISPYETYADVLTTLKDNYYSDKQIDTTEMTYNAIRGMVGSLHDRYTTFMDPKAYQEMMEDNEGEFVGIGALLGTNPQNQVYVVKVLPGGPARKYHVMAGDIIVKVDGKPTLKLKDTDVVKLIRGQRDTKVTLTLIRKSVPHPVVLTIPRDVVEQEVVQSRMLDTQDHIGYISLSVFNEESDVQLEKAMNDLQSQGARGLVLDLRDNPGGLLDVAARIASRFIPAGPVLWTKDKTGPMEPYDTIPGLHHWGRPLVVLVNGNSASAAEILSGSIKDTGAGILVGEKTFGKGVVQTIMGLRDGSAVKITTQHYYTARKHDINHKGIEPNILVKFTNDDQRKLVQFMKRHPDAPYDLDDDRQLQTALTQVTEQVRVAKSE